MRVDALLNVLSLVVFSKISENQKMSSFTLGEVENNIIPDGHHAKPLSLDFLKRKTMI